MIERSRVRIPEGAVEEFSSLWSTFCAEGGRGGGGGGAKIDNKMHLYYKYILLLVQYRPNITVMVDCA